MQRSPRSIVAAALMAASLQLGGRLEIRHSSEKDFVEELFANVRRRYRSIFGGSPGGASPGPMHARNGGGRRKAAMAVKHARKYGHRRMGQYHV